MKKEKSVFLCNRKFHYLAAICGVFVLIVLDQFTKYLVLENLKGNPPFVLLENIFQLEYLENRGAAFGLFQNQRVFFFLSVIVINSRGLVLREGSDDPEISAAAVMRHGYYRRSLGKLY